MPVSLKKAKRQIAEGKDPDDIQLSIQPGKRTQRVLMGSENLSLWDDEELSRGRRKDPRGRFVGPDPIIVPKAIHDELVKRTFAKAHKLLQENLVEAVQTLADLMKGKDVDDAVKLRAANMIIERLMGKAPETVHHTVEQKPFQTTMDRVLTVRSRRVIDATSQDVK